MKHTLTVHYEIIEHWSELNEQEQLLVQKAQEASLKAYAPYSNFLVGASVLLQNGEIVTGNNQENIAYPSGLCAERVALFYVGANYPDQACSNAGGGGKRNVGETGRLHFALRLLSSGNC